MSVPPLPLAITISIGCYILTSPRLLRASITLTLGVTVYIFIPACCNTIAILVLASALASIPKEYYEIAEIYGASRWFKFKKITLLLIKYPLILTLILIFEEDSDDFTYAYMFTGDTPYPDYRTEIIALYAYHKAFSDFELGFGCAIGFIIAAMVFIITLAQLRISKV